MCDFKIDFIDFVLLVLAWSQFYFIELFLDFDITFGAE